MSASVELKISARRKSGALNARADGDKEIRRWEADRYVYPYGIAAALGSGDQPAPSSLPAQAQYGHNRKGGRLRAEVMGVLAKSGRWLI